MEDKRAASRTWTECVIQFRGVTMTHSCKESVQSRAQTHDGKQSGIHGLDHLFVRVFVSVF